MTSPLHLWTILIAGVIGEVVFELYAWLISPLIFGLVLEPANLVAGLTKIAFGVALPYWAAFGVHFMIGAVAFALFVVIVHRVTGVRLVLSGVLAGLVLWFVAQGILAPILGRPFMMEFGAYTQSSFVGHVGMTTLMAFLMSRLHASRNDRAAATS